MNKEFRESLKNEICKIKETDEYILYGYGAGVYDSYTYILKKYDEFHKPVVVPDFVAEWIESPDRDLNDMYLCERPKNVYEWTFGEGDSLENSRYRDLLDAIENGYEVEDEQKYYVSSKESVGFWFLSKNNDNEVVIGTNKDYYDRRWESLKLTEQEIKDYDSRYMAFAVKAEEVE